MKKSIITILFVAIIISSRAQLGGVIKNIEEVEIIIGPTLISLHGVDYGTQVNYKTMLKTGFVAGVGFDWRLSEKLSITTKFLYERKGRQTSSKVNYFDEASQEFKTGDAQSLYSFDYLSVPITLIYLFDKPKNVFIEGGPYISYLLKAQATESYLFNGTGTVSSVKSNFADFDFGILMAVGYFIPIKKSNSIKIRLFGTYGFVDISHYPDNVSFHQAYNQSVGLAVDFLIKKTSKDRLSIQ